MEEASTPVDPKRVFSALMNEIDATKTRNNESRLSDGSPGAQSDVFESSATKELHAIAAREIHSSASKDCRTSTSSDQRSVFHHRPNTGQSKASSMRSLGRAFKSTIRTVTPMELKSSPMPETTIPRPPLHRNVSVSSRSTSSVQDVHSASIDSGKHARK